MASCAPFARTTGILTTFTTLITSSVSAAYSPPIHVHADIRRTRLLGVTHAPNEGGCMMVRSRDNVYRMKGVFEVDVAEKAETVAETFLDLDNVHGLRLDRMVGLGPAFGEWISLRASNRSQPPESLTV